MRQLGVVLFLATALSAQEGPKNVHLTGLSPLQLQRTMNLMRSALGVPDDGCRCDRYCTSPDCSPKSFR